LSIKGVLGSIFEKEKERTIKMSVSRQTIRACLLYEFKMHTSAAEAARKICKAFGEEIVSERAAQYWYTKFRLGIESTEDSPHSGRPTILDNSVLKRDIEADPKQTCQGLAEKFCVGKETIRRKLGQIGKVWKLSRWVPHMLTPQHKQCRMQICAALLERQRTAPFLDRLVTCDEKWINHENPRQFRHWLSPGEPPLKVHKPMLHQQKSLLCIWWSHLA